MFRQTPLQPSLHLLLRRISFSKSLSSQFSNCTTKQPSLILSYLIDSCGLSPNAALSASQKINLKSTQNPDSVLQFLKNHGFNTSHIASLVSFYPRFLLSKVDSNLKPKIQFWKTLGLSDSELADLISSNPHMLYRSLKSQIISSFNFLQNILQTNENIIKALKRSNWLLSCDLEKKMGPNIDLLKELEVPNSRIAQMVMAEPGILLMKTDSLRETVERVESFGFGRKSLTFTYAVLAMRKLSRSTWDAKVQMLKSLGWSEEDVIGAFRRAPVFMMCSEKKMRIAMDFFVNKMKWSPSFLSCHPKLLMFSMKRRVIPRSRVWEILRCKELVKDGELIHMLDLDEDTFLKKYVQKYEKKIPYLMKAYMGELEFKWLDPKAVEEKLVGFRNH